MEAAFWQYMPIDTEQENKIWDQAVVTLDTNCLLHLYRYTTTTRKWFLEALLKLKGESRLWLSHQVGEEFFRNRPLVAWETRNALKETRTLIEEAERHIKKVLKQHDDVKALLDGFKALKRQVDNVVEEVSATGSKEPVPQHDEILRELKQIFDAPSMIGPAYSREELVKIYAEGRERYAQLIPPGYMDAPSKPEPLCYGDLVMWKQLMEYSKHQNRPTIFVTGDMKLDWWFEIGAHKGTKIVHPMLRQEFMEQTGNSVWLYDRDDFLREAKKRLVPEISEESIEEVRVSQEPQRQSPSWSSAKYPYDFTQMAKAIDNLLLFDRSVKASNFDTFSAISRLLDSPQWKLATGQSILRPAGFEVASATDLPEGLIEANSASETDDGFHKEVAPSHPQESDAASDASADGPIQEEKGDTKDQSK